MNCVARRGCAALCLSIAVSLLFGCTQYVDFPITVTQTDGITRIPLRAGLYMTKEFKELTPLLYKVEFHTDVFGKVGEALRNGATNLVNRSFKEAVILEQPEQAASKNLDVLVVPAIDAINNDIGVKIKWTIKDMNGKIVYMNTFTGTAAGKEIKGIRFTTKVVNAWTLAIEDHFDKAYAGISGSKWWDGIATR
jgi:hypothetical protein